MKFGRTLRERTLKEWRFYAVNYDALKKNIKASTQGSDSDSEYENKPSVSEDDFFRILEESKQKLSKFYHEKESWALDYILTLEERVQALRDSSSAPPSPSGGESAQTSTSSLSSSSSNDSIASNEPDNQCVGDKQTADLLSVRSPTGAMDFSAGSSSLTGFPGRKVSANCAWLKDEYRRVGKSQHFKNFIYAKKSLTTFDREIDLLLEFLFLNKTAFSKILKKFDKRTGSMLKEDKLAELRETHAFLDGEVLSELKDKVSRLIDEVNALKPTLPEGWEDRKVYTIGCFDLFHRGHQNVLRSLREFGYFIVAGIHDDESYFKLKNKYTIDNLETRMANVKPFVDQLYVIPSTDPLMYIKSMVSDQDIETGSCCYARGDDMLNFPGREWVESVMPVHFVPRTESCSSTLIRTIYHAEDEGLRAKAAFAKTRYDGKPVDEDGNVLKLSHAHSCPVGMNMKV